MLNLDIRGLAKPKKEELEEDKKEEQSQDENKEEEAGR